MRLPSRARVVPLLAFVATAAYFLAFVPYGFYLEDEGLVLYHITRAYHGQLPYIDFHTGYAPALFYANALLFRLFGVNVIALRVALALVNAAAAALLLVLARRVAPLGWAVAGMLAYVAFLPFFGGEFASFNIPYPSWYTTLGWLASTLLLLRYEESGRPSRLVLAGVAAGACFAFKPNAGAFAVAAGGLTILMLATVRGGLALRRLAALALAGFGLAVAVLFGFSPLSFEVAVFVLPWLALALVVLRRPLGAAGPAGSAPLREVVLFGLGAALPTVPWLTYLAFEMPLRDFLREVLLVGGGVQQAYWIPYPLPEWWALTLCVVTAGAAAAALGLRAGRLRLRTVALAGAAVGLGSAAALLVFARIPEGLALSVIWQLENASFYLVPLALGAGVWWIAGAWSDPPAPQLRTVAILVVSALAMLEEMNPRMDFMHLVMGVPASVPVFAFLGGRLAGAWRAAGRPGRVIAAGVLAIPLAIAGSRIVANFGRIVKMDRVGAVVRLGGGPGGLVPAVGVEAGVTEDLASLQRVVRFVQAHTRPADPLFGFPAMTAVNFLAARESPVRHDYFFPGRPAHVDEAEVVAKLAAVRPPYIVTLNDRFGFFVDAPAYFFILREWVRRNYVLALRTGRYDVLRRRDLPPESDARGDTGPAPARPLPAVQTAVAGASFADRLAAVDELGRRGGPADVPVLLTALHEVHRTLRSRVAAAVLA
ncbi:MAG TPA: glycosyltransferase family 39 protein, partial [Candidatus Limnocylindria bacterium]|nr:glycosyltransferase family 39 protein [Candidatus Limnocylindria bacterium]